MVELGNYLVECLGKIKIYDVYFCALLKFKENIGKEV